MITVGVITSTVAGILLNKYHKYILMVRVSAISSFALTLVGLFTFLTKNVPLIALNMVLAAGLLVPVIPIGIDFSAELTFPIEETVCTGWMLMCAQALGFFLALIVLQLALVNAVLGLSLIVACLGAAAIISLYISEDLRRLDFVRKNQPENPLSTSLKEDVENALKISSEFKAKLL